MRALVTGASGYIGHHLCRRLRSLGWEVVALTRPTSDLRGLDVRRMDCEAAADSVRAAVADAAPDVVFHLAAAMSGSESHLLATNVDLGLWIVRAMAEGGCRRFIDAGSFWEYGSDGSPAPRTAYARSKREFHQALRDFARQDLCLTTLVLYDVYGPGDWRGKLIPWLMRAAKDGSEMPMTPGRQRLGMVHVEDTVKGFVLAAELSEPGYRTFALDGAERHCLREIVSLVEAACGRPIRAVWGALPYRPEQIMEPARAGDELRGLPGWAATIPLEEGLRLVAAAEP